MTSSTVAVLLVAFVAIVIAQPSCPPPTPLNQFTVNFWETVIAGGRQASYYNTMSYSGSTLQQKYDSRTTAGILASTFIVNATLSDPNDNGKFWIIDMDKTGKPEACTWGLIMEMSDPIDINPPLIPYLNWETCTYVGTNKIAGQRVYQYHMTNSESDEKMMYYINTQTSDPVRYRTDVISAFWNGTQINDYQAFQYGTQDPKNFWLPKGTPGCLQRASKKMKDLWNERVVRHIGRLPGKH